MAGSPERNQGEPEKVGSQGENGGNPHSVEGQNESSSMNPVPEVVGFVGASAAISIINGAGPTNSYWK